ncbi:phosphatase PAP2 family protein [Actinomyces qiguomingii]|uniref:phosphatase PAP2 family protein n=1 Tax=Actinomyces qiguomingii TaxID=2057800 RepID=UPI000CA04287|nr:phosphatase PAP2 family protein [Actinomyces qiguomingii]
MTTPSTSATISPEYRTESPRPDTWRNRRALAGVLAALSAMAVFAVWWLSVMLPTGQAMEQTAFVGSRIGARFVTAHARSLLHVVSLPAAVGLVLVVLLGALWRGSRRRALWAAAAVVAINVSTQVIKYLILWRPDYGLSLRFGGLNTLPSGHTAVAASAAVALIVVAAPRWRPAAAWAGALLAAAMGYSTLACQWHRPGDVIAALLLATAWGAAAIACGAWADEPAELGEVEPGEHGPAERVSAAAVLGGLGILAAVVALALEVLTWRGVVDGGGVVAVAAGQITRTGAFIAYAAGAVGTVAVASMGMAALALLCPSASTTGKR